MRHRYKMQDVSTRMFRDQSAMSVNGKLEREGTCGEDAIFAAGKGGEC